MNLRIVKNAARMVIFQDGNRAMEWIKTDFCKPPNGVAVQSRTGDTVFNAVYSRGLWYTENMSGFISRVPEYWRYLI